MDFFEGSGNSGTNVEEIFQSIAESVYDNLLDGKESGYSSIQLSKKKNAKDKVKKKKKCC